MNHVNKGLKRLGTDKTRAKLSYSSITQKNDVSHDTEHRVHCTSPQCAGKNVRIPTVGVNSSPAAADMTRTYVHPSLMERLSVSRCWPAWFCHPKRLPMVRTPTVKRPKTWCTWIKGSIPSTPIRTSWSLA